MVDPEKAWKRMCLMQIKPDFYVLFSSKTSPPKLNLDKISYRNCCNLACITKNVCIFRKNVPSFDIKLK